jgi:hypothetical protein
VFGTFNMVNFTSTRNFEVAIPTNLAALLLWTNDLRSRYLIFFPLIYLF